MLKKLLNNMKNLNFKKLSVITLIDFVFLSLVYFLARLVISRVREYYALIQNFSVGIDQFGYILQQNASQFNINELGQKLGVINQLSNQIILWLGGLFILIFFIYSISQSLSWNLLLNNFKLNNYKAYLKKFTLLNIPVFILSIYLVFILLINLRPFILDYWFEGRIAVGAFIEILFLFLLVMLIKYYTTTIYIFLNKHSLKNSLILLVNKYYITKFFLVFVLTILISLYFVVMLLRINSNSITILIISALLFLSIYNFFKLFLVNKLEKI